MAVRLCVWHYSEARGRATGNPWHLSNSGISAEDIHTRFTRRMSPWVEQALAVLETDPSVPFVRFSICAMGNPIPPSNERYVVVARSGWRPE